MIRNLQNNDIPDIMNLLDSCRPYVLPHHEYVYWIQGYYHSTTCFVFEEDGKIIGFLGTLQSIEKSTAFIWQICVDPDYRRKKIALKLLYELETLLKEGTIDNIQLTIADGNTASLNLFQNFSKQRNLHFCKIDSFDISGSRENVYQIQL